MSTEEAASPVSLPQPQDIPEGERDDAMGAYLMMFASLAIGLPIPLLNIVASIIYFFLNRKISPFVAFHSLQALLSHIPVVMLNAGVIGWLVGLLVTGGAFLPVFFWYLSFTVLVNIAYIAWSIVALVKAKNGRFVYMPIVGRFSFGRYYGPGAQARRARRNGENRPPAGF